jgi:hypothetical protein
LPFACTVLLLLPFSLLPFSSPQLWLTAQVPYLSNAPPARDVRPNISGLNITRQPEAPAASQNSVPQDSPKIACDRVATGRRGWVGTPRKVTRESQVTSALPSGNTSTPFMWSLPLSHTQWLSTGQGQDEESSRWGEGQLGSISPDLALWTRKTGFRVVSHPSPTVVATVPFVPVFLPTTPSV